MCYQRSAGWRNHFGSGGGEWGAWTNKSEKWVPVNIRENDNDFELSLYAPGLQKERIRVSVKDDVLTVSYSPAEEKAGTFTRREYRNEPFERSFVLNGKVQTENIRASYAEGILKIVLEKDPEKNIPAQTIPVE